MNTQTGDPIPNTIPVSNIAFHHSDHLNSASVDTDANGEVLEMIDYNPFGSARIEQRANANYKNDYTYTGKELDDESGLYYYEARYYDAEIGRFTSVDPWFGDITDPQSLNKYSYVRNNPLKYVDPSGEFFETAWDAGNVAWDLGRLAKNFGEMAYEGARYGVGAVTGNNSLKQDAAAGFKQDAGEFAEAAIDMAADTAATAIPFVPAGTTKTVRAIDKAKDTVDATDNSVGKIIKNLDKGGHSTNRHIEEFSDLGIKNKKDLFKHAKSVEKNPSIKVNIKGVKKYYYDKATNSLLIKNFKDKINGGSFFRSSQRYLKNTIIKKDLKK